MIGEPSFWRVEATTDLLSPDNDIEDCFGFEAQWEVVADNVTELHHANRLAERYLNNEGYYAVRLISVWIVEKSEPGEAMRRTLPPSLAAEPMG